MRPTHEEQESALNIAIRNGDLDEVKDLVGVKHYKVVGFPLVQSVFNAAMANGNVEIAKFLTTHGHRDDGLALYNAISSRSLAMFRYAIDDLSLEFEARFFKHALDIDWIVGQDDDLIRAVLDQANECGFLEWTDFNGFSGGTEDLGGDDHLLESIRHFMGRMIATDIFFYALKIVDDNCSGEILYETGRGGEREYGDLLEISIEKNSLKSFESIWSMVHRLAFCSVEKEIIDGYIEARVLVNKLFEMATDRGCKDIFEYLSGFAEPDFKTLFFRLRDHHTPA